ncbi:MAG: hypothetical protein EON92_01105 [Burkholderiales bacterium]|nr:MAG: hypothetical protein EON92_01105 [Burkholderiales bacterium]
MHRTTLPAIFSRPWWAGCVLMAVLSSGCGGGGEGAGSGGPGGAVAAPEPAASTGTATSRHTATGTTVADVLVCADIDGDGQCGPTERTAAATVSSAAGNYTLTWTGRASAPPLALLTIAGPGTAPVSSSTPLACLDANGNAACDSGEASASSHESGLYRITAPAGQASLPVIFPLVPGFTAPSAPAIVAGNRHLTVRWATMPGALDYEVWAQLAGTAPVALSRGGIAAGAPRVHTLTNLDNAQRYRVWVKARLGPGSYLVSQPGVALPVTTPSTVPADNTAFVPAAIDLPVLEINTTGGVPVVSRDDYLTGSFALYADGAARAASTALAGGGLDIRGRGNSTWTIFAKKPYRLRFNTSTAVLGMPASRHWVLLANHGDKSLLRNETAFEISRRAGMAWTPRSRFVEVFLNGNYLGNYELAEHIRTGSNRVNVASLGASDNAVPAVTGGYLLELDRPSSETTFTTPGCRMPFVVDIPETLTTQQRTYIEGYVNGTEAALMGAGFADPATGYAAWIDVPSFVDWYLINELTLNPDAFIASTWFYKERNGKLAMGPVWDFDLSMGNAVTLFAQNPGNPATFSNLGQRCWVKRLLQDPAFVQKVKARWQVLRASQLATLPDFIDARAAALAQSQANNFARWRTLERNDWPSVVVPAGHDGEVEYLRWWLQRRMEWLDTQWGP